jgi:hypothetical protein
MNMRKSNVFRRLAVGLLGFFVISMIPPMAIGQRAPISQRTGTDTPRTIGDRPEREQYDNRAFPESEIAPEQQKAAHDAFLSLSQQREGKETEWKLIGPTDPLVVGPATYTGRATYNSGRVTSLALSPKCHTGDCKIFVGAAGGGVWTANDALASDLNWHPSGEGIPSNAIGSVIFDPTDASGKTLYAGTGEPNGSGDSEAGVGLYKSTDLGKSWSLVPGSLSAANGRSIAGIAIDPVNSKHIIIGTAVARHGSSSINGGRFTPPSSPKVGLYESTDGGVTFALVFSRPSDVVIPGTSNGTDYFRGGVTNVVFNRTGVSGNGASRVYFSVFDYGVFRSDGDGDYEQIFASAGGGTVANSLASRTEFALAPNHTALRIYVGDAGGGAADFYRVDNALVPAVNLTDGTNNPGWIKLSNPTPGTPGFASYNFCDAQCSYDMPVASPPGHPDTVWIGGQMQYGEIFTPNPPSNGRTIQRSTDAGVSFTDMTNDTQSPPLGMHPDQHAIVFVPGKPDIAIIGSDGGVIRTSGTFANASSDCNSRGLVEPQLSQCREWLEKVPTLLFSMNRGLATLQFQSLSVNRKNPLGDIMGGTQDNGTWAYSRKQYEEKESEQPGSWFESVGGDGGESGVDIANSMIRFHNYTGAQADINFVGTDPLQWDYISGPFDNSSEGRSFYAPMIPDPKVSGTLYAGLESVWRTNDDGGPRAYLDKHCNEFFGDFSVICGDWEPLGGTAGNLVTGPSSDKGTGYIVAVARTPSDMGTLWVGTRRGRVWISKNADDEPNDVKYRRIDTASQPRRFVSGIAIDPTNSNHAWISFSGYEAYTPTTKGHVFEVTVTNSAVTWKDLSANLGDQPITGIARDDETGDIFVSTDFGVDMLPSGSSTWVQAACDLPPVAVYGLTIDSEARVLYAATHGRSAWKLKLDSSE